MNKVGDFNPVTHVLWWQFLSIYLLTKYQKKLNSYDPPWLPITPIFQCRILFYYKNGGVCKKLDLNIFKIDWAIAILSSKIFVLDFCSKFWEIFLAEKNCDNLGKFKGTLKFFFLHDHWWTPLTINCSKLFHESKKWSKLAENSFGVLKTPPGVIVGLTPRE